MNRFLKTLRMPLLTLALLATTGVGRAAPPPWPEVSFTYIASNERLAKVLGAFGQTFGLQVEPSAAVQAHPGLVDGRLSAATPSDFLNQLGATYALTWYYRGGVLHVSRTSENVTRALPASGPGAQVMRAALTELGVVDAKFGWGTLADRGVVLVSGPPSYVDTVAQTLQSLPLAAPAQELRVFRLRHAPVDDRTILYRNQQITTAGVATILRSLLSGEAGRGGTSMQLASIAAPLRTRSQPLVETEEAPPPPSPPGAPAKAAAATGVAPESGAPVIQADSRLNALVIKDRPDRMPIYEQLIAILDTASQLIEIEAMIVDVNVTKMSELGIDWNGRVGRTAFQFGQPSAPPSGTSINLINGLGVNPTTVVADAGNFLMTRIAALQSNGDASIVSRPSVLTVDNMGALIDLSETFYIQSTGERVAEVTPISVGVTLRVTPHLIEQSGQRAVHLVVDIEDGAIQEVKVQNLPTVRRSTIGTQAVVAEASSLLIGGFNTETNLRGRDGIPYLSDVPGLGLLFSKRKSEVQKRERLFLITPKIVASPVLPVPAAVQVSAAPPRAPVAAPSPMPMPPATDSASASFAAEPTAPSSSPSPSPSPMETPVPAIAAGTEGIDMTDVPGAVP
ncbi:MAG: EscC/YscC/HrcC family type III secretion system outer membrane ring protein [Comamonadaceae bacterium]|nr:MAG: EscC/YscC/HrcC family type III secretion system outer membrane ring protein [Comamonadaceae bacterium]